MKLLYLCFAGALGTGARYLLSELTSKSSTPLFPVGVLLVNILGSFLIALVIQVSVSSEFISPNLKDALVIGFLGGFTTYSSFNQETLVYFQNGEFLKGSLFASVMFFFCLGAGLLGYSLAKAFFPEVAR